MPAEFADRPEEPDEEEVQEALRQARHFMIATDLVALGGGPSRIAASIELTKGLAESLGALSMILRRLGAQPKTPVMFVADELDRIVGVLESITPPDIDADPQPE